LYIFIRLLINMNDYNLKNEKIIVGTVYLIISLFSIFINILSITTFFLKKKYFSKIPIYKFYYHLTFSNFCMIFTQLSIVIPFTYFDNDILKNFKKTLIYNCFCEMDTFGYNLGLLLLFSLSIDRVLVFAFPKIFSTNNVSLIGHLIESVYKLYDDADYTLYYKVTYLNNKNISLEISGTLSKSTPVILLLSYIFCFIKLRINYTSKTSTSKNKWKYERQILLQGLTISLLFEFQSILFLQRSFFVNLFTPEVTKIYNIFNNCFVIVYTGYISASLYLFNNVARRHLIYCIKILLCAPNTQRVIPTNTMIY
uniref:G-protein coupled receptors family 1 profile domain-containing protein n=2 Tax=Strongyloides stercoralis TaxID=6248 RepID=A0AAF5DD98_STRER